MKEYNHCLDGIFKDSMYDVVDVSNTPHVFDWINTNNIEFT